MKLTVCDVCHQEIEYQWLSAKERAYVKSNWPVDGKDHDFCSIQCMNEWVLDQEEREKPMGYTMELFLKKIGF